MPQSEVARLRAHIESELVAMRQGLSGLATGTSRHQFIESKMHRLGIYEDQLAGHIGGEQAILFSCQAYIRIMEKEERSMSSEVAYLQNEHERKIAKIKQAIEDYIHGDPETTKFCFFLPSDQDVNEIKQAAANVSQNTGKPIDLIYPMSSREEEHA